MPAIFVLAAVPVPPPPLAMSYVSSFVIIPLLAIAYLVAVYGALLLAKRAAASRRSEG